MRLSVPLLEVLDRLLQQSAVVAVDDEVLEALLGLLHGGEQLVANQAQGSGSSNHA